MLFFIIIATLVSSSLGANESITGDKLFDTDSVFGTSARSHLDFIGTAAYDGYNATIHYVITKDGYILGVHRLAKPACCAGVDKGPLIWLHGLFLSSDCGILKGKDAQAYVYANACYDVWLPNVRGNKYSENHTTLDPCKDMEFWNYDFDHMALFDMPACIDYILKVTGQQQCIFVGHSQGATVMILTLAFCPEYNAKVKICFGMSVASWLYCSRTIILLVEAMLTPGLAIGSELGIHGPILKYRGLMQKTADFFCGNTHLSYPLCSAALFALLGYNNFEITPCVMIEAVGHEPSGASIDLFKRWGEVKCNGFIQKDCGLLENIKRYGCPCPPDYPLHKVLAKWVIFSSENDYVASCKDLNILLSHLTNCNWTLCHLSDPFFGHVDPIFGCNSKAWCADPIVSYLCDPTSIYHTCKGTVTHRP